MLMYCNIKQMVAIFEPYLLNDDQQQKQTYKTRPQRTESLQNMKAGFMVTVKIQEYYRD
jgi:hypothetical protein